MRDYLSVGAGSGEDDFSGDEVGVYYWDVVGWGGED